jgi:hypothetical protein
MFEPRPLLVDKVALLWFFSEHFGLPLSAFDECSVFIFIYMFFLPEGQKCEAWEHSNKKFPFEKWGALDGKLKLLSVLFSCL